MGHAVHLNSSASLAFMLISGLGWAIDTMLGPGAGEVGGSEGEVTYSAQRLTGAKGSFPSGLKITNGGTVRDEVVDR